MGLYCFGCGFGELGVWSSLKNVVFSGSLSISGFSVFKLVFTVFCFFLTKRPFDSLGVGLGYSVWLLQSSLRLVLNRIPLNRNSNLSLRPP